MSDPDGAQRIDLHGEDTGRWLVETISGSQHVFDLDNGTYRRYGDSPIDAKAMSEASDSEILEIERAPRVNSTFTIAVAADDPGRELHISSSYILRITALGKGVVVVTQTEPTIGELQAVAQAPPYNAWLLMGDEASYPTRSELDAQRDPDNPDICIWTCPRQIQRGDLVFIYFVAPRSAIHYVARALDAPVYDPTIKVNAVRSIDSHQWWTSLSPLIEVAAVSFKKLKEFNGGYLNLRGKPTTYLEPQTVDQIIAEFGELSDDQQLTLQRPVGDPDLPPDTGEMELADLRRIAAGRLSPEARVEQYVAGPLLGLCFSEAGGYRVERQVRISGAGIADYGIYDATTDELLGVVEVKIGIRRRPGGRVKGSPDLDQVLRYANVAKVPGLLIDANEIFLVEPGVDVPLGSYQRSQLTEQHLDAINAHLNRVAAPAHADA